MVAEDGLFRILWPLDAYKHLDAGVLVGWRNSDHDVVVCTILRHADPSSVHTALSLGTLYRNSPHPIQQIFHHCGKVTLQVLGVVNPPSQPSGPFLPHSLVAFTNPRRSFPQLYCPEDAALTLQIVLFTRPNPRSMQYLSTRPIALALTDKSHHTGKSFPPLDRVEASEEQARQRKLALVDKLRLHTVVRHPHTAKETLLPQIVKQINCSHELDILLQGNIGLIGIRQKRAMSVSERVVKSANNLWQLLLQKTWYIITVWIYPLISKLFILSLMAHRVSAELLLAILDWRLLPHHSALKDLSATAQQVDIRLQQFCYWPAQFITLRKRNRTWKSIANNHPEYIRFYNSLWLVANDVIIGIALGSYLIENADQVAVNIDKVIEAWTIDGLRRMIIWLMDWPAGLKLNTELATFLGDLFLWVINYWSGCMDLFRPSLHQIIRLIGWSSFAGATMPISLFSDLASILTLHIYAFYVASARIYNWQVSIIGSLFQLFRGKKINVLRKRIDSCDYDLDQLLLGTILFTLLTFLLPTVLVFYLTFASARMAIILLKAGLDTLLACLNHFPLFALMLRFKDFRRLPGGVHFDLNLEQVQPPHHSTTFVSSAPISRIHLRSTPLPFTAMFNEYFQLGNRIRQHYVSLGVIVCLVLGRFVPPIHRRNLYSLQYSMLPAQRVSISELWYMLNDQTPV